jgi:FMN-dependent NADH-azoreductase
MKRILHVACSPRKPESESEQIAQTILELLLKRDPTAVVIRRTVGDDEISHIDASYATALGATQPTVAEALPKGSMAESEDLIQELESSDILVIGTPMHNFTVPSGLKAWIDHIVRVRRTFNSTKDGYVGTLRDRPVFVAVSSGGRYSGGRVRQPDFLTPYLKAVLNTIGLHDLTFFSIQGTSSAPDIVADARAKTNQEIQNYLTGWNPPVTGQHLPTNGASQDVNCVLAPAPPVPTSIMDQ